MTNPVIQALVHASQADIDRREFALGKMALAELKLTAPEEPDQKRLAQFHQWCGLKGVRSLPARPSVIAFYLLSVPLVEPVPMLAAISAHHRLNAPADPTTAPEVTAAASHRCGKVDPPRSWLKEHTALFEALPYELQVYVQRRERERDVAVRRVQNEAAEARKPAIEQESPNEAEAA